MKEGKKIIRRERDEQRQWQDRTRTARYNERYKEFDTGNRCPNYLRKENICKVGVGEGVRRLVRLRWEYGGRK